MTKNVNMCVYEEAHVQVDIYNRMKSILGCLWLILIVPLKNIFTEQYSFLKRHTTDFLPGNFHPINQTEPLSINATLSEMTGAYISVSTMELSQQQYFSLSTLDKIFY